jgi:hypothetical protein
LERGVIAHQVNKLLGSLYVVKAGQSVFYGAEAALAVRRARAFIAPGTPAKNPGLHLHFKEGFFVVFVGVGTVVPVIVHQVVFIGVNEFPSALLPASAYRFLYR